MPIRERECKECGRRYELWTSGSKVVGLDQPREKASDPSCPDCGSLECHTMLPRRIKVLGGGGPAAVKYPYFDRGLGRQINSPAHRAEVCRQMNVTPTDGETIGTWTDIIDKDETQTARDKAKYDAYVEEMSTGEARGEWFNLLDRIEKGGIAKPATGPMSKET